MSAIYHCEQSLMMRLFLLTNSKFSHTLRRYMSMKDQMV